MGIGLTELSNELTQDFNRRQDELEGILSGTLTQLKREKEERRRNFLTDRAERKEGRTQLFMKTRDLLTNFQNDAVALRQIINEEHSAGNRELQIWLKDGKFQIKVWRDAIHYTQRKRGRR